jgi:hypothetical protein
VAAVPQPREFPFPLRLSDPQDRKTPPPAPLRSRSFRMVRALWEEFDFNMHFRSFFGILHSYTETPPALYRIRLGSMRLKEEREAWRFPGGDGTSIPPISARTMNRKERIVHAQATEDRP